MDWSAVAKSFDATDARLKMVQEAIERARATLRAMASQHGKYKPPEPPKEAEEADAEEKNGSEVVHETLQAWWTELGELLLAAEAPDVDPQVLFEQLVAAHERVKQQLREVTGGHSATQFLKAGRPSSDSNPSASQRSGILQGLRLFVSELDQCEPNTMQLMTKHFVLVYAVRQVFLMGHSKKEEDGAPDSLASLINRWDQQGAVLLEACVAQRRPPDSDEKAGVLEPLKEIIGILESLHELLSLVELKTSQT
jgi:hypothetical protein